MQLADTLKLLFIPRDDLLFQCLETNETLERWQFDIHVDKEVTIDSKPKEKSIKEIRKDIGAVIRQITASVTFLPLLEVRITLNLVKGTTSND